MYTEDLQIYQYHASSLNYVYITNYIVNGINLNDNTSKTCKKFSKVDLDMLYQMS
jgi:hypothetical protein